MQTKDEYLEETKYSCLYSWRQRVGNCRQTGIISVAFLMSKSHVTADD